MASSTDMRSVGSHHGEDRLARVDRAIIEAMIVGSSPTSGETRERVRVVVITDDVLTPMMAGPAIRAWHIAESLAIEQDVILATTSDLCELTSPHFGGVRREIAVRGVGTVV